MEKVSAMKKVALFLMIVGLAVAMVACQGAVGPKGDKGDDGADGADGAAGQSGLDGIDALGEKPGAVKVLAFNNAVDTPPESDAVSALTISMHDYFVGGNNPKFSATGGGDLVALAWDDAGVELTITVTRVAATGAFPDASDLSLVELTAKDGDGRSAGVELTLRDNAPPEATTTELIDIRLGLQEDKLTMARTAGTWTCNTLHSCTASLVELFSAPMDDADANDVLTYEATSEDDSKVAVSVDGSMLTITAVATTAVTADDGTTTNGVAQAVAVTIKATDAGDLSVTREDLFSVLVDSPPTLENAVPHAATYALEEDMLGVEMYTLVNEAELTRVFKDDLGGMIDVTSNSSDLEIASAATDTALVLTVKTRGRVTITLIGTEPTDGLTAYTADGVGQTATQEITFEVVAP